MIKVIKNIIVLALFALAGTAVFAQSESSGPVRCTADAMQCEDGSWVGRSGPNCEFACPDAPKTGGPLPVACTMEYNPVCAQQSIQCVKAPCPQPAAKTYSNSCMAKADGAKVLYKGECESIGRPVIKTAPNDCKSWFDGCNNCNRVVIGSPLGCTKKLCAVNKTPVCNEYFFREVEVEGSEEVDFGAQPTKGPEEGFVEPTTPPPSNEVAKKPNVFVKAWVWFKGWFR